MFGVPGLPAVPILYTIRSRWQPCLVEADTSAASSPCVQRIELTPYQVAQRIVHVVMAGILIWVAFIGVTLQL